MGQAILFALLAGVLAANAYPHFAKGITAERFPTVFGSSPVVNLLAGWSGLVLAGLCLWGAHPVRHPGWALVGLAVGALPVGLFHATGRTIGARDPRPTAAHSDRPDRTTADRSRPDPADRG